MFFSVNTKQLWARLCFVRYQGWRYRGIASYLTIPGWLAQQEAAGLYDLAQEMPDERPVVVEIGSWLGRSSFILAKGLLGKSQPELHCIDPFNSDGDAFSKELYQQIVGSLERSVHEEFVHNMRALGVAKIIRPIVGYSHDAVKSFRKEIDLLFIDGNHDYEAVLTDYRDWSPLVKPGGLIAFHDVVFEPKGHDSAGPGLVVKEHILNNPLWHDHRHLRHLFIARKIPGGN